MKEAPGSEPPAEVSIKSVGEQLYFFLKFDCEACHRQVIVFRYHQPEVAITDKLRNEVKGAAKEFHGLDCPGRPQAR